MPAAIVMAPTITPVTPIHLLTIMLFATPTPKIIVTVAWRIYKMLLALYILSIKSFL